MKTNNKVDISNESLQDAAIKFATTNKSSISYDHFEASANWQKEKDKAIQDKLIHRLERLTTALVRQIDESGNKSKLSIMVLEEYNRSLQLLQSIKDQQQ